MLSCICLYDALHSRPRSNCIDLHGICLVYVVRYTSTHFCGMLILAKSGCIGAMLPNYQDVLCLLAPQRSTTHRTRNTFKMMTNAQECHPHSQEIRRSRVGRPSAELLSSAFSPSAAVSAALPALGLATKEFGKKNLTMLAVPQTS